MVTEIRIYYEGHALLRPGFAAFFSDLRQRARENRCPFQLISCRAGSEACQDFSRALETHSAAWNILLIDSEGPYKEHLSVSLCDKNKWSKSHAESIFWMVEMMEAWFHADQDALAAFYGTGFRRSALKANPKVEQIPKKDLMDGLQAATKGSTKGDYYDNKTSHGPELLARIQPALVRNAAPNCQKLFQAVFAKLGQDEGKDPT